MTKEEAWKAAEQGVVVDMKDLTGLNVDVERVDVDVLLTSQPDTFNLMLLAIEEMQKDSSRLGWFQIAGIHGYPTVLWDKVGQSDSDRTWDNNDKKFGSMGGYCAHGVLTFGTWHRPYLALLEQTIYRNMVTVAGKYTDAGVKARYLAAAQKFRLPYLDYYRARGAGYNVTRAPAAEPAKFEYDFGLPDIFTKPGVTLNRYPDDKPTPADNPLYTYRFNPKSGELQQGDKAKLARYGSTEMTIRCPSLVGDNRQKAKAHGNKQVGYNLNWNVQDRVNLLLSFMRDHPYKTFPAVGSDELVVGDFTEVDDTRGDRPSGSLENLHNIYHVLIGHVGHMGDPKYAAFDPVFWFHHCNIDRYFALWQAANPHDADHPERWFPAPTRPDQTYDGAKPLYPFYKRRDGPGAGDYWTSDDVQRTQVLGYVYDDFARMQKLNQTVPEYMGKRYDWATRKPDSSVLADMPIPLLSSAVTESPFFRPPPTAAEAGFSHSMRMAPMVPPPAPTVPLNAIDPRFDRDWYVDSRVKRMAANGTFTIYFFLSPKGALPDDDPLQYASSPYLVGMHHVFTSDREGCANCAGAEDAGKLSVGTQPITGSLLRYMEDEVEGGEGVESMRPEHVEPFLKERLRWRVVFHGADKQDPRMEGLELRVGVSAKVYHDEGDATYEEYPAVVDAIVAAASAVAGA
ncbi:hypothetical protein QBC39DRAFT_317544 [Podospora conica]|nr:hypothetical protein QBC39DRAFT_317544 [Schizothecium conicum]